MGSHTDGSAQDWNAGFDLAIHGRGLDRREDGGQGETYRVTRVRLVPMGKVMINATYPPATGGSGGEEESDKARRGRSRSCRAIRWCLSRRSCMAASCGIMCAVGENNPAGGRHKVGLPERYAFIFLSKTSFQNQNHLTS